MRLVSTFWITVLALVASAAAAVAAPLVSPREHFGFAIGDDYQLATYTQTEAYFKKLAAASDRMRLVDIGRTEEGRTQWMVIMSSPANLQRLDRYREISERLARAELAPDEAEALAAEGKAVVWIDGGLHANETVATQQLIESVWAFASRDDAETRRILDNVIILFVHANPDGQELYSSWYMRRTEPAKRIIENTPRLWEKYAGHDNNRDFFMMNLRETTNINRQLYLTWFPQIVYNHHQSGPAGTIVAGPPYRDPFNYVYDPLIVTQLDEIGAAMHTRWIAAGMPGSTMKGGSVFSTWWNGGLRTTVYFHNILGLLTEVVGSPTPMEIPLVPERQIPSGDLPLPVEPQVWHFRRSIDYELTANYAVLNYAARHRDELLRQIYQMGRNSITRGQEDHWTNYPRRVEAMQKAAEAERQKLVKEGKLAAGASEAGTEGKRRIPARYFEEYLRRPELRDARGYIVPADQADFPTAVKFVNTLIKAGVCVQRATKDFSVQGNKYPAGSYVVKTDQAFRPYVLDMFEPQAYPNDFKYAGGPPIPPYDSAGWTLAYEMGVAFDRVLEGFDGPFAQVPYGHEQAAPAKPVDVAARASGGYLLSATQNDAFRLVNRLLKAGAAVSWPAGNAGARAGSIYVEESAAARDVLGRDAPALGVDVRRVPEGPMGLKVTLHPARVALVDVYGGSIPAGWTRWLLEKFDFPFEVVYPQTIDAGELRTRYDVIVLVNGAVPPPKRLGAREKAVSAAMKQPRAEDIPAEFRGWLGRLTEEKSLAPLRTFLETGGTIVTIGSSANLAYELGLPVSNALEEVADDGTMKPLPREKFFVPGSLLEARVARGTEATRGLPAKVDVYFDESPVFRLAPDAEERGVRPLLWFASDRPLRSGWVWGQEYLKDGVAAFEAKVGAGRLRVFGPEIAFRGQTHGTFKLLFNSLYLERVEPSQ
ncbi:hypothetical protein K0B96_02955 [Horticoccus luteus]|uniref:Peptidase M14 domain-containing protein n=1 Tax=Horticoccus luteus TaxID=2862869 RepID=A0A8F9TXJ9_9BACT|nr:M14 metallopeptidase family protein [Horticoccus luteus]QYM79593.1 hypothetical protein K0B96_02955 [Horticoccus luteus]